MKRIILFIHYNDTDRQLIIKCITTGLTGGKKSNYREKEIHDTTPQPVSFYIKIIAPQCVPYLLPML